MSICRCRLKGRSQRAGFSINNIQRTTQPCQPSVYISARKTCINEIRFIHNSNHRLYTSPPIQNHDEKFKSQTREYQPTTSSSTHTSLSTFLHHAQRQNLSPTSTTYLGTLYEYLTQEHLKNLAFKLNRVGGRNDSGIDLLGSWNLSAAITRSQNPTGPCPSDKDRPQAQSQNDPLGKIQIQSTVHDQFASSPIYVLIQCKRVLRANPNLIRELEGSFLSAPAQWRANDRISSVLGIMVCSKPATRGIRDAMAKSRRGLAWIMLEETGPEVDSAAIDGGGGSNVNGSESVSAGYPVPRTKMRQFLWNHAAGELCGLQGLSVGLRYSEDDTDLGEVNLLWQGNPIKFEKLKDTE